MGDCCRDDNNRMLEERAKTRTLTLLINSGANMMCADEWGLCMTAAILPSVNQPVSFVSEIAECIFFTSVFNCCVAFPMVELS